MKVWRKFHNNIPSRLEANFDHRSSNQLTKENDMLAYTTAAVQWRGHMLNRPGGDDVLREMTTL